MSGEMESLRKHQEETLAELTALQERNLALVTSISKVEREHADEVSGATRAAESILKELQLREQTHEAELLELNARIRTIETSLSTERQELDATLAQMRQAHSSNSTKSMLRRRAKKAEIIAKHSQELVNLRLDHDSQLQLLRDKSKEELNRNDEEYYTAISKFRSQHEDGTQPPRTYSFAELAASTRGHGRPSTTGGIGTRGCNCGE